MRVAPKHPAVHLLLLEKITDFDLAIPVLLVGFLVDAGFGFYEPKQEPPLAQHLSFVAECPASSLLDASLAALVEGTTGPPSGPHLSAQRPAPGIGSGSFANPTCQAVGFGNPSRACRLAGLSRLILSCC